jgi:hypothetical protein
VLCEQLVQRVGHDVLHRDRHTHVHALRWLGGALLYERDRLLHRLVQRLDLPLTTGLDLVLTAPV